MDISEIANELKKIAIEFPLNPMDGIIHERHSREFLFKGLPLRVMFTLTNMAKHKGWILSMKSRTSDPLPENIVQEIKNVFLSGNILELPDSLFHAPKVLRKFIQMEM